LCYFIKKKQEEKVVSIENLQSKEGILQRQEKYYLQILSQICGLMSSGHSFS